MLPAAQQSNLIRGPRLSARTCAYGFEEVQAREHDAGAACSRRYQTLRHEQLSQALRCNQVQRTFAGVRGKRSCAAGVLQDR